MTQNNDQRILELKEKVALQKKQLKHTRFNPTTNCSIEWNGFRYNLHTLNKESAIPLLVSLKFHYDAAKSLDLVDEYVISGYNLREWIDDVKLKLESIEEKNKEKKLKQTEEQLDALLSEGKKTELFLDGIEKDL